MQEITEHACYEKRKSTTSNETIVTNRIETLHLCLHMQVGGLAVHHTIHFFIIVIMKESDDFYIEV